MPELLRHTVAPFARFSPGIGWPLSEAPLQSNVLASGSGLQLGSPGAKPIADSESMGSMGGRRGPKGLAISSQGRIFLCDPEARVVLSGLAAPARVPSPRLSPLWPARDLPRDGSIPTDPYTLVRPVDVAPTPGGDLAIVDQGAQRILVLAFPTAFIRQVIRFQEHAPTALVFDRFGRAQVLLTPQADHGQPQLASFDRSWRRLPDLLHHSVTLDAPSFIAAVPDPACGPSHRTGCGCGCGARADAGPPPLLAVVDRNRLRVIAENGRALELDTLPDTLTPAPLLLGADRSLHYPDPNHPDRAPLPLKDLQIDKLGQLQDTALPLIALPRRVELPRYGVLIPAALDGGRSGFAWDRLGLEARLPDNTRLLISTLTSDSALEPDRVAQAPGWSDPLELGPGATPEILFQSPPGRYLWLRLEYFGDGSVTPLITQADIYGPRRSSLQDLPALFHHDAESADFLDRFLSYFDTGLAEIAATGDRIPELLDPYASDPAFLNWLGSWFDLEFRAEMPEATRREMIAEAIPYFRMRGTVDGLRRILQWHTGLQGDMPQIIEHYRLHDFASPPVIAGHTLGDGAAFAHRFSVVIPQAASGRPEDIERLKRLIAASIPAHTGFDLIVLQPGISVGRQSTIAVDTLLGSLDGQPLGSARLGAEFSTQGPMLSGPLPFHANPIRGSNPC